MATQGDLKGDVIVKRLIALLLSLVSASFFLEAFADIVPVELDDVKLLGRTGADADRCVRARAYSDWARGAMYEECVKSFRTHDDDRNAEKQGWGGWQNEYWGKTMLCYAQAADYTQDPELKRWIVEKTHAFLKEFQWPNGYLSTYAREDLLRLNPDNPDARHQAVFNIWGRKYTLWALVEIHRVTGDKESLEGAVKMADHLVAQLKRLGLTLDKTGAWHGVSSMSILRPILELYRLTGNPEYLALAKDVVRAMDAEEGSPATLVRDAFRTEKICSWYPRPAFWAKAYEILSCLEGLVDYYRLTGDARVLNAVKAYHGHLMSEELNPMGSAGYFYHFLDARHRVNAMTELCDVVHWIRLNRELLLLTGEAKYADLIEEAFYNSFLGGVEPDGRWGAHIVRSHGTRHVSAPAQTGMREHQCCPDNMMRSYFDFASSAVGVCADGTVAVMMYSDLAATVKGAKVRISGGYPYAESAVLVTVECSRAGKVKFRIPHWSRKFKIDGCEVTATGGWYETKAPAGAKTWKLEFAMSPRIEAIPAEAEELPPSPQAHSLEVPKYTVYFMEWMTPEMAGMSRRTPGKTVRRGPLVLAKGKLAGSTRAETLDLPTLDGTDWTAELKPLKAAGVPEAWELTFKKGDKTLSVPVSDFASVSNVNDPGNWFSLWF